MRSAAALLAACATTDGLASVLVAAGLGAEAVELGRAERASLVPEEVADARLAAGVGAIRVLLARLGADVDVRDATRRLGARLAARAPHVLWFIAALDHPGATAVLAAVTKADGSPRLLSFAWEPAHVVDSDAETLCALAAVRPESDVLQHARCAEVLGRDALTRRFYRELESRVAAMATGMEGVPTADARTVALLYASRLLFLCFVQAKGWLDGDRGFIAGRFDDCMRVGQSFHRMVLLPLFFGTLNTPASRRAPTAQSFGRIPFLNGGLFTRTVVERRCHRWRYPDDHLGSLVGVLHRYRFVAREDTTTWSEAAVDPEMLGRVFESLMGTGDRKAGGVFYTPQHLVARVADEALAALAHRRDTATPAALRTMRVLDPACGSGAFLVHVLERLAAEWRRGGDARPESAIRRDVLSSCIFGVDRDPIAVWLCELRLWLSVVIESDEPDPMRVPPLPNLDRNIRVGDALTGSVFAREAMAIAGNWSVARLRERYVRATGGRKRGLGRALDREERRRVLSHLDRLILATSHARRELMVALRSRDLFGQRVVSRDAMRERRRLRDTLRALRADRRRVQDGGALPFSFAALFADAQAAGGFDVVLGNPPWVRVHRIPAALRLRLRETYEVFRSAPWAAGAAGARVATGFASQVDLAALFAERAVALLRPGGVLSLLLPVKLWRSLAGGGLRHLLVRRTELLRVEDHSESRHAFDAAAYPSLLVARSGTPEQAPVTVAIHDRQAYREWLTPRDRLAFDDSPGAPWLLLDPASRSAFNRLRRAGTPLSTVLGTPRLGVKSGCNAAFLVRVEDTSRDFAWVVDGDGERGKVERHVLRPVLRGDAVTPWTRASCEQWIVWTHDERGPMPRLPDLARAWLRRRYTDLTARADASRSRRWWTLFRVEAADPRQPRVVWADLGRRPAALVLPAGDPCVPLNSCYVLPCRDEDDAWAVAALLNSSVAAAWLNALAEPARGGYRRYMGWTVGQFPVPTDWDRARALLAAAGREAPADSAGAERLLGATLHAYGLRRRDVASLLETR